MILEGEKGRMGRKVRGELTGRSDQSWTWGGSIHGLVRTSFMGWAEIQLIRFFGANWWHEQLQISTVVLASTCINISL